MLDWHSTYTKLRDKYLAQSRERLERIEAAIEHLSDAESVTQTLDEVRRHFHWLSGSGGIYGFPEITEIGKEAELLCEYMSPKQLPSDKDVSALRSALNRCKEAFRHAPKEMASSVDLKREKGKTELLVIDSDDNALLRVLNNLADQEVVITRAKTLNEAYSYIDSHLPSCIVLGLPVPDGSGYEFVEKARSLPGGEEVAICIISKEAGFLDKVQAIHSGADVCVDSATEPDALLERVNFLLEKEPDLAYRIIYVEDDPTQAEYVQSILSSTGYHVTICPDARTFERALSAERPDLILLDIVLPEYSGFELSRYIRQQEAFATVPIIFLTTEAKIDSRILAARSGGDDYLVKPVIPAVLLSTVAAKLERARFLKSMLYRDGLTRLLTHTAFMSQAQGVVARKRRRPEKSVGAILIDIDHFKHINDTYGHPVGDRVIVALSSLLRRRLRRTDLVGRYGGEEFIIIVEDLTADELEGLTKRLLDTFSAIEHNAEDGTKFKVTFSAGIAMLNSVTMDLSDWVFAADQSLLEAKQAGRNRIVRAPMV